jgi:hypothetical protein
MSTIGAKTTMERTPRKHCRGLRTPDTVYPDAAPWLATPSVPQRRNKASIPVESCFSTDPGAAALLRLVH